jgi:hypothetical protein
LSNTKKQKNRGKEEEGKMEKAKGKMQNNKLCLGLVLK